MFSRAFTTSVLVLVCGVVSAGPTAPGGRIAGRVLNADGKPVAHAIVVLCDQRSGIPVSSADFLPFSETGGDPASVARCFTDAAGNFAFDAITRAGTYRIFAQSWPSSAEPPADPLAVMGDVVQLLGVAADLDPRSPSSQAIELRPLGEYSLTIDQEFGNDQALLLISTAPQVADPILGFHAWGAGHLSHLLGYHRMVRGRTTIRGLPEGEIYLSVFSADNNPGFGHLRVNPAARARAGETGPVAASIVAGWSDARHSPPENLQALCGDIEAGRVSVPAALGVNPEDSDNMKSLSVVIARYGPLDREIRLADGRLTTVGDLIACEGYLRLAAGRKQP